MGPQPQDHDTTHVLRSHCAERPGVHTLPRVVPLHPPPFAIQPQRAFDRIRTAAGQTDHDEVAGAGITASIEHDESCVSEGREHGTAANPDQRPPDHDPNPFLRTA